MEVPIQPVLLNLLLRIVRGVSIYKFGCLVTNLFVLALSNQSILLFIIRFSFSFAQTLIHLYSLQYWKDTKYLSIYLLLLDLSPILLYFCYVWSVPESPAGKLLYSFHLIEPTLFPFIDRTAQNLRTKATTKKIDLILSSDIWSLFPRFSCWWLKYNTSHLLWTVVLIKILQLTAWAIWAKNSDNKWGKTLFIESTSPM